MKLYWSPQTRSSRAVWMLEEAGVNYDIVEVDIRSPDRKDSEDFRAASPMGKVPALEDGDVTMCESAGKLGKSSLRATRRRSQMFRPLRSR